MSLLLNQPNLVLAIELLSLAALVILFIWRLHVRHERETMAVSGTAFGNTYDASGEFDMRRHGQRLGAD